MSDPRFLHDHQRSVHTPVLGKKHMRYHPSRTSAQVAILAVVLLSSVGTASSAVIEPLDRQDQATIIDGICTALDTTYVYPKTATETCSFLRDNLAADSYKELTDLAAFCGRLTEDLRSVSNDRHLGVRPAPPLVDSGDEVSSEEEQLARELEDLRRTNFCFERVEVLPENVGYIKLNCFPPAEFGGATVTAAMKFVGNVDGLIFDLRENRGGQSSSIQLISSYLFDDPIHLNNFYVRERDETEQYWTQAHIDGQRMSDVPVWVLTSRRTFSAGEGFAYQLKHLDRATVIGERTAGGAHPTRDHAVENAGVVMRLPYGRAVNPITGTNWEGVGVEPHIQVPLEQALGRARIEAISTLLENAESDSDRWRLEWVRDGLEIEQHSVVLSAGELAEFVGTYGPRNITLGEGVLRYHRADGPVRYLVPMGDDRFLFSAMDYFRVRFERDADGRVNRIVGQYDDGRTDGFDRSP